MSFALEARHLSHTYARADRPALADVTFDMTSGVTALVGVNGAGKSTLLRARAGWQRPQQGAVLIDGLDPYRLRQRKRALTAVSLMPQMVRLPPNMTVLEVVTCVGWLKGTRWSRASRLGKDAIEAVGLSQQVTTPIRKLSGGMVRRVALAQALATSPDVLLLDEPSTGLDPEQRRTMIELVGTIRSTVLFSSHVMEDVEDVAERVIVLDDGQIVYDGTLAGLRERGGEGREGGGRGSLAEAGFLGLLGERRARR